MKNALIIALSMGSLLVACTKNENKPAFVPKVSDVVIRSTSAESSPKLNILLNSSNIQDCRNHIKNIVCWVDPIPDRSMAQKRDCLPESEKFATYFEGHFDRSPVLIQKMYCHLDRLWIEKTFYATAYASPIMSMDGKILAGGVGIREEVLTTNKSFDDWISWKEETSFGGPTLINGPGLGLIRYHSNQNSKDFFIDTVLNHEFGHLFDFANNINQINDCEWVESSPGANDWHKVGKCEPAPNSWTDISWVTDDVPKLADQFPMRNEICFYFCNGHFVPQQKAAHLFQELTATDFASVYTAMSPYEDWADTFELYLAHDYYKLNYGVTVNQIDFDLSQHFNSSALAAKRDYIKNFLMQSYKYPGE